MIRIPSDTTALSLGANAVAERIRELAPDAEIKRSGTRGLFFLEPLIEVETPNGWVAYGPLEPDDVTAELVAGGAHPKCLGDIEAHPYLVNQQRLTFSKIGKIDPLSLDDYRAHRGFAGLTAAAAMTPADIVATVTDSGLRGRGGAAFPTGIKWNTVLGADSAQKYIVCNADEGDSGTFADRLVMECDPYMLIEGMIIAGFAVGATQGYIYLRREYPLADRTLRAAIENCYASGLLGDDIAGSGRAFNVEVRLGADAYICGEETSLLESLEGKRGLVRAKPPLPALVGLFGQPTVVNNVLSLAAVPFILDQGARAYADYGVGRSRGTLPIQLAGNIECGGLIERAFGLTLREVLNDYGQGCASGLAMRAVQVGGPLGAYLPDSQWDLPLDYEAFAAAGAVLGHGGVVVFDARVDMAEQARFSMEFCAAESCGKCTPCRIGSTRGVEVIDRIRADDNRAANLELLNDLCDTMIHGSLCAMGGMTPFPVQSAVKHFADDFGTPNVTPEAPHA
ncbi:formate dehydrogenase [Litorivicinus lipolyticus]|uniref:NADH-quinone oxidoreductase subunit F n=1 Tax=Litorivicinus lipolyticus TaxID=418701 RepID=A0A5Q2Q7I9_9GAMM|nr:NADH-ubiquinone oxidoreductase-F iron-sulfur binding region domain-containing protein [Litorivicinus lipolyticus]QGG80449.1 formate dehydrogenase [Litorivicinus lipolyticus]